MKITCLLVTLFLSGCNLNGYASEILAPTKNIFEIGENISVNLTNAPINEDEWVAIYSVSNNKLLSWRYTEGISTGTIEFGRTDEGTYPPKYGAISKPGQYIVKLFSSNSPIEVDSALFSVSTESIFILPKNDIYYQDQELVITYSNAPNINRNWIGLYLKNELNNRNFIKWSYIPDGENNGAVTLKKGTTAGDYEVRLFLNNSFKLESRADLKIIARPEIKIELNKNDYELGEKIPVRFLGAPENNKDWIGIFSRNEPNNRNILRWVYTDGNENGQVTLSGINIPGDYEARFFSNNSFNMEAKVEFSILEQNVKQITVSLLSDISWIEPQVYDRNLSPSPKPSNIYHNISIKSKNEIIKAYDARTKQNLPITYFEGIYEVGVQPFEFSKFVTINYIDSEADPMLINDSNRSQKSRINGYTALSTGYYYKPYKWGDAFSNAENKMKELGFSQYTRMVKGDTSHFSMMWNSLTIKDILDRYSYQGIEDSVSFMAQRATDNNLDFIAYYKDMGDSETLKVHPEWECKTPDNTSTHASFVMMDFTSPWKEVVKNQLLELAQRGVKGVYFDYIHSPQWGCFGSNMQQLFETETGLEAPKRNDLGHHWSNHQNWVAYMEFQSSKLEEAFTYWKMQIKQQYPNFQFIISSTYVSGLTSAMHGFSIANVADSVKVEFDHGKKRGLRHSVFFKDALDNQNLAKPTDNILMMLAHLVPRDFSQGKSFHSWAYGFANTEHLKGFVVSSLALGGIPDIYIAEQYLRSDFDPNNYIPIFDVQTPYHSLNESIQLGKTLSKSLVQKKPMKFIGVYFDELNRNSYKTDYEAAWRNVIWPSVGAYESFLLEGMPVIAINRNTLFNEISDLSMIYLPIDESLLPVDIQELLLNFENIGGTIIRHDESLNWSSINNNENTYTTFRNIISQYKSDSPFWVKNNNANKIYTFFYQ